MRVDLEVDDGVVQLTGELADFLVQATVADLIEFVDELHGVGEIAFLKAIHQFPRTDFQGRLEVSQQVFVLVHVALAAGIQPLTRSKIFSIFSFRTWAVKGLTT
ncbi:hypothetical protein D3C78_1615850 [compost metagenome]